MLDVEDIDTEPSPAGLRRTGLRAVKEPEIVRRLNPAPPPRTEIKCWCGCGEVLTVVWSGTHAGGLVHGRDWADPVERTYFYGDSAGPQKGFPRTFRSSW